MRDSQSPQHMEGALLLSPAQATHWLCHGKPWRAPSRGGTCPRSSREGAGTPFIQLVTQTVSHQRLGSPAHGSLHWCPSVTAIPWGRGSPLSALGWNWGQQVPAGGICCPVSPYAAESLWGNMGDGGAAPHAVPRRCPRASPPAPRGGTPRSSRRSQCCSQR